jgi:hypothetical protein
VISKTHARDFPALSAARTLPLREYRSPSGIEWSTVAMEIEIYGRIDDARLAAHGIPGCRAIYPQKRAAAGRAETRIRSFHVCASVRSLAGCTCAWSDACASHRAGYRARMTLSLRDYVRIRHGSRVRVASRARRWRVRGV